MNKRILLVVLTACFALSLGAIVMTSVDESEAASLGIYTGGTDASSASSPYTGIQISAGAAPPKYVLLGSTMAISDYVDCDVTVFNPSGSASAFSGSYTFTATGAYILEIGLPPEFMYESYTINVVTLEALNFDIPPTLDGISGSVLSYTPTTNLTSTITCTEKPAWVTFSGGKIAGTMPSVTDKTTYAVKLHAVSGSQTADQILTFDVYPVARITGNTNVVSAVGLSVSQTYTCNLPDTWSVTGTLPAGLTFSNGKITGTPTASGDFSVTLKGTTTVGPVQHPTIVVNFSVSPKLAFSDSGMTGEYVAGHSISYSPSVNLSSATFKVTDGPAWLAWDQSTGSVKGTPPSSITETTGFSFKLTATTSNPAQTVTKTVTFQVLPVLKFTSAPTAAMLIVPVYDYQPDGSYVLNSSMSGTAMAIDVTEAASATFRYVFIGDQATHLVWDFGDGVTSSEWTPIHTYTEAGEYVVRCTAVNDVGTAYTEQVLIVDFDSSNGILDWAKSNVVLVSVLVLGFVGLLGAAISRRRR